MMLKGLPIRIAPLLSAENVIQIPINKVPWKFRVTAIWMLAIMSGIELLKAPALRAGMLSVSCTRRRSL